MIDLKDAEVRDQLSQTIVADIDDACEELYAEDFRDHLGASILGDRCSRKLWYHFRWVKPGFHVSGGDHPGRMLRLWQRGREQEENIHLWLEKAGFKVEMIDPETDRQWRFSAVDGHVGGSCDGIVWLPDKFEYPEPLLLEVKTIKGGADFNNYFKKGVRLCNDKYWVQMCLYGKQFNLSYCLFLLICKDNDKIYTEVVPLNHEVADYTLERAEGIVSDATENGPERISQNSAKFECKFCHYQQICHYQAVNEVARNCRSCQHSSAVENGQWFCNKFGNVIPKDFIPLGCDSHEPIF